jgi:hypothetical protein
VVRLGSVFYALAIGVVAPRILDIAVRPNLVSGKNNYIVSSGLEIIPVRNILFGLGLRSFS